VELNCRHGVGKLGRCEWLNGWIDKWLNRWMDKSSLETGLSSARRQSLGCCPIPNRRFWGAEIGGQFSGHKKAPAEKAGAYMQKVVYQQTLSNLIKLHPTLSN
jgi:hypothetical protein